MAKPDVLIVGAGLAGLCCARKLQAEGVSFRLLDASDAPGGRIRTDHHDGFLLDRGFQVFLTAYPEALAQLDYGGLDLHPFPSAVSVRHNGDFHRLSDPSREPGSLLANLMSEATHFRDKFRLARLRRDVQGKSVDEIFLQPEISTRQALMQRSFSHRSIDRFFKPLIGGAMLDPKMVVSSRMFEFLFKMFSEGEAALPARGMQAIPDQLAAGLGDGAVEFNQKAASVEKGLVRMASGETLEGGSIVIATQGPEASHLLGYQKTVPSRSVCCLYFAAKEPPVDEPVLVLSGSSRGPITTVAFPNLIAPGYAPAGQVLISVTVLGLPSHDDQTLVSKVRSQLKRWYGLVADEWRMLRIYRIAHGLPVIASIDPRQSPRVTEGLYVCGDHRSSPSIQGAMESGRLAAETLIRDLRGEPDPDPVLPRHHRAHKRAPRGDDD